MAVERSELRLDWPAELFATEARVLLTAGHHDRETLGYLLAEAFHAGRGLRLFDEVAAADPRRFSTDPWGDASVSPSGPLPAVVQLAIDLLREVDELPRYEGPRYYSARRTPRRRPILTLRQTKAA